MQTRKPILHRWGRAGALVGVCVAGLVAIVGSGGGVDAPECSFFSNVCNPTIGPIAVVTVSPARATVQVGGTATFATFVPATNASYQWKHSSDGGLTYVAIPGATGPTYTLTGANLSDDGSSFSVDVSIPGTSVIGPVAARLYVSSMPGVVFADTEFRASDWSATPIAVPPLNGPTSIDTSPATGGNPGAFRSMAYALTAGAASLRVFYISQGANYDPAQLGAVYKIDYSEDCIVANASASIGHVTSQPLVQQSGRKYLLAASSFCRAPSWQPNAWITASASEWVLVDGPPCGTSEACPDFSGSGAPLQLGYARSASQAGSAPSGSVSHGIDNWKLTVWRR